MAPTNQCKKFALIGYFNLVKMSFTMYFQKTAIKKILLTISPLFSSAICALGFKFTDSPRPRKSI